MTQDNRRSDSTTSAPGCAECDRLQNAVNLAVWHLEEDDKQAADRVLREVYSEENPPNSP